MFLTSDSRTLILFLLTFYLSLMSHLGDQTMVPCDFYDGLNLRDYFQMGMATNILQIFVQACYYLFTYKYIKICLRYFIVFRGNYAKYNFSLSLAVHSSFGVIICSSVCPRQVSIRLEKLFSLSWPSCLIVNTLIPEQDKFSDTAL